jgi:predicted dehydrogenase
MTGVGVGDVHSADPLVHDLVIVGAGRFANVAAEAWARVPGVRVAAVADVQVAAAQSLADSLGAATVGTDDVFSGNVAGLAYIATPPWTQHDFAARALRSGITSSARSRWA